MRTQQYYFLPHVLILCLLGGISPASAFSVPPPSCKRQSGSLIIFLSPEDYYYGGEEPWNRYGGPMEDEYYGPLPPRGRPRREDGPYPSNSFGGRYNNNRDYESRGYYEPLTRREDPRRSWRDYRQDEEEQERWGGGRSGSSYFDKGKSRTRKDPSRREHYPTLDRDEPVPSTSWKPRSYSKTRTGDRRQRFDYEEDRYEESKLPPYSRRSTGIPSPYDDRSYLYRPSERQDIFTSPPPPRPRRNGVVITPLAAVPSLFDTLMGTRSASPFASSSLGLLSTLNSMRSMMMMSMNGMPNFEVGGPASEAEIQPLLEQAEDILNDDTIAVAALGSDIRILQVISSSYSQQQAYFSSYDVGSNSLEQVQLQVGIQGSLGESGMALLMATGGRLEQIRLQTSDGREMDVPVRSRSRGYSRSKAPNNGTWRNRRSQKPVDSSEDVEIVDAEVISDDDYQDNGETRQGYERDGSRFSSWGKWRGPNRRDYP